MKKKKLKKKIKKLEHRVNYICKKLSTTIDALNRSESHVTECKEAIKKLEANPDDIKKLNNRIDGALMDTNYLRSSIQRINERCDILDRRTQTDYDKIISKDAVKEGENNGN